MNSSTIDDSAMVDAKTTVAVDTSALRRWVTLVGMVLILAIIVADGYEAWQDYRTLMRDNQRLQVALDRALAEQTTRMLQGADVVLSSYADWTVSPQGRNASEQVMREKLQADIKRLPFVQSAQVAAADGRVIASTQNLVSAGQTIQQRTAFNVPKQAQNAVLYIGRPFIGARDGSLSFVLSKRINDANNAFAGVVVARVAFDYLTGFYANVDITSDTLIRLSREDGVVLAQYPNSDEAISDNLYVERTYTSLHQPEQVYRQQQAGQERVVALHRIDGYPLVIEVSRLTSSVVQPWVQRELGSAARTLVLVILAGLLLMALRNALQRRDRLEQERRRLEHELENAQRAEALGILAASVAHDFNNALTGIVGYAELLRKPLATNVDALTNVDRLLDATERARLLVRRVLTFNPHRSLSYQPLLIGPVIIEALQQLQPTLPPAVTVQTSGLDLSATILGDATEVYQVVINLCSNAIHAMPEGGCLRVNVEVVEVTDTQTLALSELRPGRWLCMSIIDSGVGLAADQLNSIFEPFYTTRSPEQGTGIGLTVVRNIIVRMNGALAVTSRLGAGTTMSVYWPLIGLVGMVPAVVQKKVPTPGHGETVLVVDDDIELVMLAEELLASLGYEPVGFADARVALEAFRADPDRFDLVLTDERMQPMRGCDLARAIHLLDATVPVVLMTGHHDGDLDQRAKLAGIRTILDKPLRIHTLRAALGEELHAHQHRHLE